MGIYDSFFYSGKVPRAFENLLIVSLVNLNSTEMVMSVPKI